MAEPSHDAQPGARRPGIAPVPLLQRSVLLVTGKGGVGKSTVAAALARLAARRGKRVLLIELEAVSRVGPRFGSKVIRAEPVEVAPNLQAVCLDAAESLRFFASHQLKVTALVNLALRNKAVEHFFQAVPAMKPILFLFHLWRTEVEHGPMGDGRWDLIVCDLPTSGFAAGMYAIPDTLSQVFRVGPISGYGKAMRELLTDPARAGLVLVALPEELPVVETLELRAALLARHGVEPAAIVVNGMPEDWPEASLTAATAALDETPDTPWLWAARLLRRRRQRADAQVELLQQGVPGRVMRLPFLYRRDLPLSAVDELAGALEGEGL